MNALYAGTNAALNTQLCDLRHRHRKKRTIAARSYRLVRFVGWARGCALGEGRFFVLAREGRRSGAFYARETQMRALLAWRMLLYVNCKQTNYPVK